MKSYLPNKSKVKAETYNFMYVPQAPWIMKLLEMYQRAAFILGRYVELGVGMDQGPADLGKGFLRRVIGLAQMRQHYVPEPLMLNFL